jgi:ribosomal-protein-alanine N-acetyltransferase
VIAQPSLQTQRTCIRSLEPHDAPMLRVFRVQNRTHMASWEPLRNERHYTLEGCSEFIADAGEKISQDRGYPLAVFSVDEAQIIAMFNFANVVRGAFQACHLGYAVAADRQATV